jgi:predicted metallopeptidase
MAIRYFPAPDIQTRVESLIRIHNFHNVDPMRVRCFRSHGSQSKRVLARIWSFPKIWQQALNMQPHYVIEVLSERFDKLAEHQKNEVLVHELKHIPKKFSGGLRKHDKRKLPKTLRI